MLITFCNLVANLKIAVKRSMVKIIVVGADVDDDDWKCSLVKIVIDSVNQKEDDGVTHLAKLLTN